MAKIAYILLCHKNPDAVIQQARQLTAMGDCVAIHFDARGGRAAYRRLRAELVGNASVVFAPKRRRCGWGEWSLVDATLGTLRAALAAFPRATHFYLLSGDCAAIKSARYAHDFLDAHDRDYIESFDFFDSDWIRTGLREERLVYRHFFNERRQRRLFYASVHLQKSLRMARAVPADIDVQIGSQWWCLRRGTIEAIMKFAHTRRDVMRFFRTTWIPDETFFQTLVRHLVPDAEIETRSPTFLMFTDYGMPVTFYNDHYDLLLGQDYLFARKISPEAEELKARLGALYADDAAEFRISDEGRNLFHFLTGRGRVGRRFARRFWETESTLGRERELMIVVCKKWHVAKRLVAGVRAVTDLPAVEYLFNEEQAALPDLGGIQATLDKRMRHCRALVRMLFDYYGTNRLVLCVDPANLDLLRDFCGDRSVTRLLELRCAFSDADLVGHAMRMGLASDRTPPEAMARLLPTIRGEIAFESDRIRDAGFEGHLILNQSADPELGAGLLARFLDVPREKAHEILDRDDLFAD